MPLRNMFIKPTEGVLVRDPRSKTILSAAGGWVQAENYWLRRIADGSVQEVSPPKEKVEAKEKVEDQIDNKFLKRRADK